MFKTANHHMIALTKRI